MTLLVKPIFSPDGTDVVALGELAPTDTAEIVGPLVVQSDSEFTSTGALKIPVGATSERPPTPVIGMLRMNSETSELEAYNGTEWILTGGSGKISEDDYNSIIYGVDGFLYSSPTTNSDKPNTSTGFFGLPVGTSADRPATPADGFIRYNTDLAHAEVFGNGYWQILVYGRESTPPTVGTATVINATRATVSYTPSASSSVEGIIGHRAISTPGDIVGELRSPDAGTITVGGLTPNTAYTFRIVAFNLAGESIASEESNSVTTSANLTVPNPPIIGIATLSAGLATVRFTAPENDGGAPIISYTAVSNPPGLTGTVTQSGSGEINIGGVNSSEVHTFKVYATNSVGDSVESSESNMVGQAPGGGTVELDTTYLIIGGGGGGQEGGGGAGGLLTGTTKLISSAEYQITVGAGGAPAGGVTVGNKGGDTVAFGFSAIGGGFGGAHEWSGGVGGSGGGGGGSYGGGPGGAGTLDQGNAGCQGKADYGGGGGGGGAGGPGVYVGSGGGFGGDGKAVTIALTSHTYAAGGGGGGFGGGGGQDPYPAGQPGYSTKPYGNGGNAGGAGNDGVVIIAYPGSKVFSGGTVTTDNGFTIHTFDKTGTLTTPPKTKVSDVVLFGGGGGGGSGSFQSSGGGGAGGFISSIFSLDPSKTYPIVIGAGGGGDAKGSDTTGFGFTALGGGAGAGSANDMGLISGGSGGGSRGRDDPSENFGPGTGSAGQGFAGGLGGGYNGGGGGGAGAAGSGNSGGNGIETSITGTKITVCGGGGGGNRQSGATGAPGSGGGGFNGQPAQTNSGSGGSGGGSDGGAYGPSNGASGALIISYEGSPLFSGGTITSVNGNTIHKFTTSGDLVPL